VRIRYNRRFKHTRDREDDVLDLRGFISVKGVKALGNKLSSLPVTEVSLEPPVEELENALEKELQAARAADEQREKEAKKAAAPDEMEDESPDTEEASPAPASSDSEKSPSGAGQGSLF
jgi:septal ring factor EnvC (AmiA/AmiB activator)